jgi:hypothetical protein
MGQVPEKLRKHLTSPLHGAYSFFSTQLAGDLLIAKESLFLNYNQKNNIKWMKKMTGGWLYHLYFLLLE